MGSDANQVTEQPQGAQAGGFWRNRRQRRKALWLSSSNFAGLLNAQKSACKKALKWGFTTLKPMLLTTLQKTLTDPLTQP
jgi:hypothetical protein